MKKFITLVVLVGLLVFSVATSTFARTIYGDYMVSGNDETDSRDADLNQYVFGVENTYERLKFIIEYSKSTVQGDNGTKDANTTGFLLKGGYGLVKNDVFELYGNISCLRLEGDSATNDAEYSPIMIGIDSKRIITDSMTITVSLDYAFSGEYKQDGTGDLDADYMVAKVKYNCFFTEHLGASLGYNWSKLEIKDRDDDTSTGFTIGGFYQF